MVAERTTSLPKRHSVPSQLQKTFNSKGSCNNLRRGRCVLVIDLAVGVYIGPQQSVVLLWHSRLRDSAFHTQNAWKARSRSLEMPKS